MKLYHFPHFHTPYNIPPIATGRKYFTHLRTFERISGAKSNKLFFPSALTTKVESKILQPEILWPRPLVVGISALLLVLFGRVLSMVLFPLKIDSQRSHKKEKSPFLANFKSPFSRDLFFPLTHFNKEDFSLFLEIVRSGFAQKEERERGRERKRVKGT